MFFLILFGLDDVALGILGGSLLGLVGTGISSVYNKKSVDAANSANLQAVRESNKANSEAIDKMNAYNDLRNIVKQYDAVGLNRNLISGLNPMQSSVSTAIPSNTIPHQLGQEMQGVYNTQSILSQLPSQRADITQKQYQNRLLAAEARQKEIENVFLPQLKSGEISMQNVQIKGFEVSNTLSRAQIDKLYTEIDGINKNMQYVDEQIKLVHSQIADLDEKTISQRISNYINSRSKDAQVQRILSDSQMSSEQLSEWLATSVYRGQLRDLDLRIGRLDCRATEQGININSPEEQMKLNSPSWSRSMETLGYLTGALGNILGGIPRTAFTKVIK